MTHQEILSELKHIRAASHSRSIEATETDIQRLINRMEKEEQTKSETSMIEFLDSKEFKKFIGVL